MREVRLSALAELDLDDRHYVATQSESTETAHRVLDRIGECFTLFGHMPLAGRKRDDVRPGMRSFVAGNYLIYYRVIKGQVMIVRVVHGSREQEAVDFENDGR